MKSLSVKKVQKKYKTTFASVLQCLIVAVLQAGCNMPVPECPENFELKTVKDLRNSSENESLTKLYGITDEDHDGKPVCICKQGFRLKSIDISGKQTYTCKQETSDDCGDLHQNCYQIVGVKTATCINGKCEFECRDEYDKKNDGCICKLGYHQEEGIDTSFCILDTTENCGQDHLDCNAIEHVKTAVCESGKCIPTACQDGYRIDSEEPVCKPICDGIKTQSGKEKIGPGICGCYLDDPPEGLKNTTECPCGTNWQSDDDDCYNISLNGKDSDGDGVVDCKDICPLNPTKFDWWSEPQFVYDSHIRDAFDASHYTQLNQYAQDIQSIDLANFSPLTVYAYLLHSAELFDDISVDENLLTALKEFDLENYCQMNDWDHDGFDQSIDLDDYNQYLFEDSGNINLPAFNKDASLCSSYEEVIEIYHAKDLIKLKSAENACVVLMADINLDDYGKTEFKPDFISECDVAGAEEEMSEFYTNDTFKAFPFDEMKQCMIRLTDDADIPLEFNLKNLTFLGNGHTIRSYRGGTSEKPLHRCSLSHSLFKTISNTDIHDLNLDFDVLDIDNHSETVALLASLVKDTERASTFTNISYSGTIISDASELGSAVGGLIAVIDNKEKEESGTERVTYVSTLHNVKSHDVMIYAPYAEFAGGLIAKSTNINYTGIPNTYTSLNNKVIVGGAIAGGLIGYYGVTNNNNSNEQEDIHGEYYLKNIKIKNDYISSSKFAGGLFGRMSLYTQFSFINVINKTDRVEYQQTGVDTSITGVPIAGGSAQSSRIYSGFGGGIGEVYGLAKIIVTNVVNEVKSVKGTPLDECYEADKPVLCAVGGFIGSVMWPNYKLNNFISHVQLLEGDYVGGHIGVFNAFAGGGNSFSNIVILNNMIKSERFSSGLISFYSYFSLFEQGLTTNNGVILSNFQSLNDSLSFSASSLLAKFDTGSKNSPFIQSWQNVVTAAGIISESPSSISIVSESCTKSLEQCVSDTVYWLKNSSGDIVYPESERPDYQSFTESQTNNLIHVLNKDISFSYCQDNCTEEHLVQCYNHYAVDWSHCLESFKNEYICSESEMCMTCAECQLLPSATISGSDSSFWEVGEFELYVHDDEGFRTVRLPVLSVFGLAFEE